MSTWSLHPVQRALPSLPAMKPVLAHVTLNHEAGDIVRQPTEAIHRYRGHLRLALERSAVGQVLKSQREREAAARVLSGRRLGTNNTFYRVNQVPQLTNGQLPLPGCNTAGEAVGGNRRKSTGRQNFFNK